MRQPRETDLVRACLDLLAIRQIPSWRNNTGAARLPGKGGRLQLVRFSAKGVSDILGILPPSGRLLAVECKTAQGRLTPDQAAFLDRVRGAGGLALCVRSVVDLQTALDTEGV